MKVRIAKTLEQFDEFEFHATGIKEILNGIKHFTSEEYITEIFTNPYKYIILFKDLEKQPIALNSDVILYTPFDSSMDSLLIIKEFEGEIPAAAIAPYIAAAGAAVGTTTAGAIVGSTVGILATYAVTAIVNIAISMALNMVVSMISPSKEFSADPAETQHKNSTLFNGAPLIREQGGPMPLAYGEGYCGGVLISSSISSVDA